MLSKKACISVMMVICAFSAPLYSMQRVISFDDVTPAANSSIVTKSSTWPWFIAKIAVAATLSGIVYFKGYQRWSYGSILESVRKEFIEPDKNDKSPLFMHWRFSDFAAQEEDYWGSARQLKTGDFQGKLLEELHCRRITDKAGAPVKSQGKEDGKPLDQRSSQEDRVALLPQVVSSMDYELSRLTAAMEKLAPMDSLLCPGLGIEFIEQICDDLSKDAKNIATLDDKFNWKKPYTWTIEQEKLINDTMVAKAKQIHLFSEKSWFSFIWYNDPYFKAREYYWILYKFKSRLEQMKKVVLEMINIQAHQAKGNNSHAQPAQGQPSAQAPAQPAVQSAAVNGSANSAAPAARPNVTAQAPKSRPQINIYFNSTMVNGCSNSVASSGKAASEGDGNVGDGNTIASAGKAASEEDDSEGFEPSKVDYEILGDFVGKSTNGSRDTAKEDDRSDLKHNKKPAAKNSATLPKSSSRRSRSKAPKKIKQNVATAGSAKPAASAAAAKASPAPAAAASSSSAS